MKWLSAEITQFPKVVRPFFTNEIDIGLDNANQLAKFSGGCLRMSTGQNGFPGLCQPHLGGVGPGNALGDMHMNRLQRTAFIEPKENDVCADLRKYRTIQRHAWRYLFRRKARVCF